MVLNLGLGARADAAALEKHPVRQELVDEIKARTKRWEPMEVAENPMAKIPRHLVKQSLGSLGMDEDRHAIQSILGKLGSVAGDEAATEADQRPRPLIDYSKLITAPVKFVRGILEALGLQKEHGSRPRVQTGPGEAMKITKDRNDKAIRGSADLPSYYNVREAYPYCSPEVLDQDLCGACWGFSSSGMLGDRMCMQSKGRVNVTLSPQDMVNCAYENYGCSGGYLIPAFDFLITDGIAPLSCTPYVQSTQQCSSKCANGQAYNKFYCKPGSLKILSRIPDMQREIYENGPIVVSLTIWEDMYNYRSGIYERTSGAAVGGHSVRLVGWGHDETNFDHLYWIAQNQWTDRWGEKGYIRIKAGELGIDQWALSCAPDMPS